MSDTVDQEMQLELVAGEERIVTADVAAVALPSRRRSRRLKRRAMTFLRVSHRWSSLVLGLFLVLLTTSGAVLVVGQYIDGVDDHAALKRHTAAVDPVSMDTALGELRARYPDEGFNSIYVDHGSFAGYGDTNSAQAFVDPGTGAITGFVGEEKQHGWYRLLVNFHDCFLTCEDYPGHVPALGKNVLDVGIPGIAKLTWSGLIFLVLGFLMFTLVVGGVVLWWPGIRRWRRGFEVRRQNRYKRDYDLHKLIGIVALPPLLIWALSGMQFGAPVAKNTIDAVLPGATTPNDYAFTSTTAKGPDIGFARALEAARARNGGGKLVSYTPPASVADDPTAVYSFTLSDGGFEWYGKDSGTNAYSVDRHDAGRVSRDTYAAGNPSQLLTSNPIFAGHFVSLGAGNWWDGPLRWTGFLFGLTPLVLMITGLSTWFYKRGVRKRARRRRRERAAAVPGVALAG